MSTTTSSWSTKRHQVSHRFRLHLLPQSLKQEKGDRSAHRAALEHRERAVPAGPSRCSLGATQPSRASEGGVLCRRGATHSSFTSPSLVPQTFTPRRGSFVATSTFCAEWSSASDKTMRTVIPVFSFSFSPSSHRKVERKAVHKKSNRRGPNSSMYSRIYTENQEGPAKLNKPGIDPTSSRPGAAIPDSRMNTRSTTPS